MSRVPTRIPTANEQDSYDTVRRLGGLQAAATATGRTLGSISSAVRVYVEKTGAEWPAARRAGPGMGRGSAMRERNEAIARLPDRIDALEAIVETLSSKVDQLLEACEGFARDLAVFTARQPVLLAPARDGLAPTHRRIADGGVVGRREARQ